MGTGEDRGHLRASIQTTRRVIPAEDRTARSHTLDDGNTLAFATRDTANVLVTDLGVDGMRNAHGLEKEVHVLFPVLLGRGNAIRDFVRDVEAGRKVHGLADGKGGEEDFLLVVHDDLAEVLVSLLGVQRTKVNIAGDGLVAFALVGQHVEKGGAAGTGTAQDQQHLTGLDATMAVVEDGLERWFLLSFLDLLWDVELREDVFLNGSVGADDLNGKVLPRYTEFTGRNSGLFFTLLHGLNLVLKAPLAVVDSVVPLGRGSTAAVAFDAHSWVGDRWSVVGRFEGQW